MAKAMANGSTSLFSEEQMKRLEDLITNATQGSRDLTANATQFTRALLSKMLSPDPRRNLNDECGYPSTRDLSTEQYQDLFDRDAIAARVVEITARESWQNSPSVYEVEDADTVTPFEESWDNLGRSLYTNGLRSWYQDEEGNPIWEYLRRVDEMSGIGQYGILLFGLNDGKPLSEPVVPKKAMQLTYLRVFPEVLASISQLESDPANPRYGQPVMYHITFNDPREQTRGAGVPTYTMNVHWTRVLHVADVSHTASSCDWAAVPRMRPVLNNILALQKPYHASAEGYWKSCFTGLSFETHPHLGGEVEINTQDVRDQYEKFINGLQRALMVPGVSVKTLSPSVVDPSPHIDVNLTAICIKLECPKRVFMGSEVGQLSSDQGERAWNRRLNRRNKFYTGPRIVSPFTDRLIWFGVLPEPKEGYSCYWPMIGGESAMEQADLATKKTAALSTYVQGGGESVVQPLDFLTRFLGMKEEEAQAVLARSLESQETGAEDTGGSPLLGLVGGITGMIELFKLAQAGGLSEEQLKQQIMLFFKVDEERAEKIIADGLPEPLPEPQGLTGQKSPLGMDKGESVPNNEREEMRQERVEPPDPNP